MPEFENHALGALWAQGPALMGIVNVTPDSFSDGGEFINADKAIAHGLTLHEEGADILDVGGESTRPGASFVSVEEEIARVIPVIDGLAGKVPWISIDTRRAKVMEAALEAGANIINDISGLTFDEQSVDVASRAQCPLMLMHMQGQPQDMQENPIYNNVIGDVIDYLKERVSYCATHRIEANLLVLDPGIGFGKTLEDNLLIISSIREFSCLDIPVMLGASRKSFISQYSGKEGVKDRLPGSLATAIWGLSQNVNILRVHDVRETVQALKIYQAILNQGD